MSHVLDVVSPAAAIASAEIAPPLQLKSPLEATTPVLSADAAGGPTAIPRPEAVLEPLDHKDDRKVLSTYMLVELRCILGLLPK